MKEKEERDKIILAADLAKLHAEVNQLRNQEFLIPSSLLVLITTIYTHIDYKLFTPLIVLFGVIYYWHFTLTVIRTRITQFLIESETSAWEDLYRAFADRPENKYVGQKKTVSFIFKIIGFGLLCYVSISAFNYEITKQKFMNDPCWYSLFIIIDIIVIYLVLNISYEWLYKKMSNEDSSMQSRNQFTIYVENNENDLLWVGIFLFFAIIMFILHRSSPKCFFFSLNVCAMYLYYWVIKQHESDQTEKIKKIREDWKTTIRNSNDNVFKRNHSE